MFNSKENSEIIKYIIMFGNHLIEEEFPVEILNEFNERHDFCMQELEFWKKRNSPARYNQSLKDLLSWMHKHVESNF
jgi:hypothetical protein